MQRLSLEQEQIKKSMEQLNEELKREQERSGDKVLGDLDEVKKEMEEVAKQLEQNQYDDKLIEKQNRILSRMLDAQLSQREKDFEPKRESKPGDNVMRNSPPEIVLQGPNSFNALKEDFLKLQKEGYTEDYEALISKYLMELKKNGVKEN
jgi:septal ring factor EnvC (AmiA/AmiB activator)